MFQQLRFLRFAVFWSVYFKITSVTNENNCSFLFLSIQFYFSLYFWRTYSRNKDFDFDCWCFNATFNNILAISWRPVLVVEEAGVPGENHRPWASNW
jgi:hypothetical protein